MAQELFMIGLITQNLEKSKDFYRRLGIAVPEESAGQRAVAIKMEKGATLLLSTTPIAREFPKPGGESSDARSFLEVYLQTQAAVEAKYAELIACGYQSYRAPFLVNVDIPSPSRMCFALVDDPDGNTILLSGDAAESGPAD
jgi:catechol 2,3-dioxygenase-like lactoylglutathione lyase family enzyme